MGKEIGIDLGTTNTVVSYVNKKGRLRPLRYEGEIVIPSAIYFLTKNKFVIGKIAKKKYMNNPLAGVVNFKSLMGEKEKFEIIAENGDTFKYQAKRVASNFLNGIITTIENQLIKEFGPQEGCIGSVVITVPAKFNDVEKEATKWAAHDAGFMDVKLAAEPTAAAVAHKQESGQKGASVLVYDFGGGTFDVSVIQEDKKKFIEVATGGDKHLGGNRLTERMAEYFFQLIEEEYAVELPFDEEEFDEDLYGISVTDYMQNRIAVIEEANKMKEALSEVEEEETQINLILPENQNVVWNCTFTRLKLEEFIREDIERTIHITNTVVQEAKEKGIETIDRIVLAGGSAQIPMIQRQMEQYFAGNHPVYADDITTLISRGAALMAKEELDDMTEPITNVQYGVAANEGIVFKKFKPIIMEGQKLPCTGKEYFKLIKDNPTRIEIPYFERDIKNYPDASRTDQEGITLVDTIIISNLPYGLKKDEAKVSVAFTICKDGTLKVQVEVLDQEGNSICGLETVCERASNLE